MSDIEETIEATVVEHHNNKYKDSLFRRIFGAEDKRSARWRLDLYNAFSGKNHTNPDELEITTLKNVIFIKIKNDVSFLVDSQMNLWEHQSTLNPNMPLRGLFYFAVLYHKHLINIQEALFTTKLVKIPSPKYVVFYNGNDESEDVRKLRLSEAFINFDSHGDFEWTATMININKNHNEGLHKNCKSLYDYSSFCNRIKSNIKNGMENEKAIDEEIDWAIQQNLLEGLIREQRAEVRMDLLTEFDQEQYDRIRRREGYEDGIQQKTIEAAKNFYANGASIELIAKSLGMTVEQVQEIVKDVEPVEVTR